MQDSTGRNPRSTAGAILALLGGMTAMAGVLLTWGTATLTYRGGRVFGQELPASLPIPGSERSLSFSGTADWTGIVALVAGLAVVLGAAILLLAPRADRMRWVLVLGGAGVLILVVAFQGAADVHRIARDELVGKIRSGLGPIAGGLGLLNGLMDRVIDQVANLFGIDAHRAIGPYVTAAGGALAGAGAFMAGTSGERGPGKLERTLSQWRPDARADLLRVLNSSPEIRSEEIEALSKDPEKQWMAELVTGLEDDRQRENVVQALQKLD